MPVRTVTGTIRRPNGAAWADFPLAFTVAPGTFTEAATYPPQTVDVTTGPDGTFSVGLETGIAYEVGLRGAYVTSGSSTRYPEGSRFSVVVPDGTGAVTLEALRAERATPVTPTLLGRIEALEGLLALMTGGTTGQILEKQSGNPLDIAWVDHVSRYTPEEV